MSKSEAECEKDRRMIRKDEGPQSLGVQITKKVSGKKRSNLRPKEGGHSPRPLLELFLGTFKHCVCIQMVAIIR